MMAMAIPLKTKGWYLLSVENVNSHMAETSAYRWFLIFGLFVILMGTGVFFYMNNSLKKTILNERLEQEILNKVELEKANMELENQIKVRTQIEKRVQLFSSAVEQSSEGIAVIDLEGQIQFTNEAFAKMHGYRSESLRGKPLSIFHTSEQMVVMEAANRQTKDTGEFNGEIWHVRRDELIFPSLMHNSILLDKRGTKIGIIETMRDITDIKQTQQALEFKNTLLKAQQEASIDGILVVDGTGKMISFNHRFVELWEIPNDILDSRSDEKALDWVSGKMANPEEFIEQTKYLYSHQHVKSREEIALADGRTFDRFSAPVIGEGNNYYGRVWYFRDISIQKDTLRALKDSEALFKNITTSAQDAIIMMDDHGSVSYWNNAAEQIFGYSREEIRGKKLHMILGPPRYHDAFHKGFSMFLQTGKGEVIDKTMELAALRKNGTEFPMELSLSSIKIKNRWSAVGILRDISERKNNEENMKIAYERLKDTQAQLVQSAKLASIGELAAGVAHELNQPLMIMRMASQLSERSMNKNGFNAENNIEFQESINKNTKRMMKIIDHLRTFSRQSSGVYELLDLNKVIEGTFLMMNEQLRLKNITTIRNLTEPLPQIKGDANQIEQVLLNLITNAQDTLVEKIDKHSNRSFDGQIEIITEISKLEKNHIDILIIDNGQGIPESKQDKIFDPFFTTKEVGKGTGLGLSISYGIIKEHNGEIALLETSSQGTCFGISLPISKPGN